MRAAAGVVHTEMAVQMIRAVVATELEAIAEEAVLRSYGSFGLVAAVDAGWLRARAMEIREGKDL